ncbi:uncharacterized protein G2W53_001037 [Senna tora]|uniref:Uncharacterized protein n=1 Tax=Senna tora TaxID=362788 RepID=A0A834XH18_9FABA|nr:uncharacterized protein G2W53_001037 [Senna tora]
MERKQTATPQGTGELSLQARVERLIAQVVEMASILLAQIERIDRQLNAMTPMVMQVVMQNRKRQNCPTLTLPDMVGKVTLTSQIEKIEEIIFSLNAELELPQKTTGKDVDKPSTSLVPSIDPQKNYLGPHIDFVIPSHTCTMPRDKIFCPGLGRLLKPREQGDLAALLHYYTNAKCHFGMPHLPTSNYKIMQGNIIAHYHLPEITICCFQETWSNQSNLPLGSIKDVICNPRNQGDWVVANLLEQELSTRGI